MPYKKLTAVKIGHTEEAIRLFEKDPLTPALCNHALQGKLKGIRAIKAGYDLRILYTEEGGHTIVFFIEVGTHDQIYLTWSARAPRAVFRAHAEYLERPVDVSFLKRMRNSVSQSWRRG